MLNLCDISIFHLYSKFVSEQYFFFKVKCNKLCFLGAKILNIDKRATHKFVSDILQFHKCRGNVNKNDVFRDFL